MDIYNIQTGRNEREGEGLGASYKPTSLPLITLQLLSVVYSAEKSFKCILRDLSLPPTQWVLLFEKFLSLVSNLNNTTTSRRFQGLKVMRVVLSDDKEHLLFWSFEVRVGAVDSSDAFNSMLPIIIEDKLSLYCGFDENAMNLYRSWTSNVKSICKVNDTLSDAIIPCNSLMPQGFIPSALIYAINVAPAILYINKHYKVELNKSITSNILSYIGPTKKQIVFEIVPKMLMDDLTIYTRYNFIDNPLGINDNEICDQFDNDKLSIAKFLTYKSVQRHSKLKYYLNKAAEQFDLALNFINNYLNWNNIPTNNTKTVCTTFQDRYYQTMIKLKQSKDLNEPHILNVINNKMVDHEIESITKIELIKKLQIKNDKLYTKSKCEAIIKYAIREKL